MTDRFPLEHVRSQYPAFQRRVNNLAAAYFDGPAGSQTPQVVIDAVAHYLGHTNANHGAPFATSCESDALLDRAHETVAAFLGADDPACVAFGANMTSLTFAFSRALAQTWNPGDEIIVTRLDHDANVTPWVRAAEDRGVTVRYLEFQAPDCTLQLEQYEELLTEKTRLVAVGLASNATGTVNPVRVMADRAHAQGAQVFVDAVHYAPHRLIDVTALDADYLVCSAYKFFGPHVGVFWGRRALLEELSAYRLRPAPAELPGKWMTGTQNHEGIAGVAAAVEYLATLGDPAGESLRDRLQTAFNGICEHETQLLAQLLEGLAQLPAVQVWGITDAARFDERVPTVSITCAGRAPEVLAQQLAEQGLFAWPGNHYALQFTESLGLEPGGTLRFGILHYNTAEEVDRLLAALANALG